MDPSAIFETELIRSENAIREWSIAMKRKAAQAEENDQKRVKSVEDELLLQQTRSAQIKTELQNTEAQIKEMNEEKNELQKFTTSLEAEIKALKPNLENLEKLSADKTRLKQNSLTKLSHTHNKLSRQITQLNQTIQIYSYLLGIAITPNQNNTYDVVFRHIDPEDTNRPFTFTFAVTKKNTFKVTQSDPTISMKQLPHEEGRILRRGAQGNDLEKQVELNTPDLSNFLWAVRSKFKELV